MFLNSAEFVVVVVVEIKLLCIRFVLKCIEGPLNKEFFTDYEVECFFSPRLYNYAILSYPNFGFV